MILLSVLKCRKHRNSIETQTVIKITINMAMVLEPVATAAAVAVSLRAPIMQSLVAPWLAVIVTKSPINLLARSMVSQRRPPQIQCQIPSTYRP